MFSSHIQIHVTNLVLKFQEFFLKIKILVERIPQKKIEFIKKFKVLCLAQKSMKYFEICVRPVSYLYKHCIKMFGIFQLLL